MATETFIDDVIIDGTEDEVQLRVQGHSTQTEPLQEWQDSSGAVLAQITEDGRFQNGDGGLSTPDALIEAHRDQGSSLPHRGLHSLGKIAGVISTAIAWLVSELELVGTAAISSIHSAVRARLTHSSTGDSSSAELRAGDFEVINQSGTSGTPVGSAVGVQGRVDNQDDAYLTKASGVVAQILNGTDGDIETAIGFEVAPPDNDGTIDTLIGVEIPDMDEGTANYAIRTGAGIIHLGDLLELEQLASDPDDKADVVQFYAKDDKIFAKAPDPDNTVYDLTQGLGGGASLPSGVMMPYGGSSAPSDWLLCDGSAVSRTTYADLFSAIGTTFGVGDGSTTFNLPDLRGRVAVGAGQGSGLTNRTLGSSFGEEDHQLTESEMPSHNHAAGGLKARIQSNSGTSTSSGGGSPSGGGSYTGAMGGSTAATGSDTAHNNMQPSLALTYIIKT